ncbi:cobalamin biosynthesis protein [Streptomyces sp. NPDC127084]|uniref:cobalamin biosynthesis protein n=1 Tax=Streptomyces sp. NPDC127084 TaxID=3347133 RepID=UPI003660E756
MSPLVVGVGARRGAPPAEVVGLIRAALRELAGDGPETVVALATVETKADEPGLVAAAAALSVPLRAYPARTLAGVPVPNPSGAVRDAVGTASVAEAAALAEGGELVVPKRTSGEAGRPGTVTCAIVRRSVPLDPKPPIPEPEHRHHHHGRRRPTSEENV